MSSHGSVKFSHDKLRKRFDRCFTCSMMNTKWHD